MKKIVPLVTLGLLCAVPTVAYAQKKPPVKSTAANSEEEVRKGPAALKVGDRELRQGQLNSLAQAKREEAIERLTNLIQNISGPQKAELIFRLAELNWESQKYFYFLSMQAYTKAYQEWFEAGAVGQAPGIDEAQSKAYKNKALVLYQDILDNYKDYERTDEVLYVMAFNLYESGQEREALQMYQSLIDRFPNSKNVADAYLQIGDHHFNHNQLDPARKAYEKALSTQKPKIYSYAVYKLAWCDFNYKNFAGALTKMKQVVAYADTQKGNENVEGAIAENDRLQLREEALSDMTTMYSRLDNWEDALKYYQEKVNADLTEKYISKIASLFNKQGKWKLQLTLLKELNNIFPNHPKAPQNQSNIVLAYAQLEQTAEVRKEVRRLIDLYRPQSPWAIANKDNEIAIASAYNMTEEALRNLVEEYHRDAQKFKSVDTYILARDLYAEYLNYFHESESAYRMRFLYAEILYALKDFATAAPQYDKVAAADPKGEFAKLSAYNAILCYEKVAEGSTEKASGRIDEKAHKGKMEQVAKVDKLEAGKKYDPIPLTDTQKQLANAYDRFVEIAPNDEEVVKVKYKSARVYYVANQFDDASKRFGEIIDRWPKDPLARYSAEHILESYNVRENWTALRTWAEKFAAHKLLMSDAKFAQNVNTLLEGSAFKEIQTIIEPKGNALETAEAYQNYVTKFSKGTFTLIALYNSILYYDKANYLDRAIEESNRLLKNFNKFAEKAKSDAANTNPQLIKQYALFGVSKLYERIAMFPEAADSYELFYKTFKKSDQAADAIYNAALFRQGMGQYDQAINDYNNYLTTSAAKEDAATIYWRIGLLYEKAANWSKAAAHFDGYESRFNKKARPALVLYSRLKMAQNFAKAGDKNKANEIYQDIVTRFGNLPEAAQKDWEAVNSIAQARFQLLEPSYNNFMSLRLSLKKMAKDMEIKMNKLAALEQEYAAILALGDGATAIACLYRIGDINNNFSKTLKEAPIPPELTEDQQEIYLAALEEQTFPLEEKAIEAFETANTKSFEMGLYNEWTVKTQQALSEFDVNRFPEQHSFKLFSSEPSAEQPKLRPADNVPYSELMPPPVEETETNGGMLQ